MHELALAHAVVKTALGEADKRGMKRLTRVDVRVGELQRIRSDVFDLALRRVVPPEEPRLRSTRFEIVVEPVRFRCRPCGHEFGLGEAGGSDDESEAEAIHFVPELAHAFLQCPSCGSPDFEIVQGRGVSIESFEGE